MSGRMTVARPQHRAAVLGGALLLVLVLGAGIVTRPAQAASGRGPALVMATGAATAVAAPQRLVALGDDDVSPRGAPAGGALNRLAVDDDVDGDDETDGCHLVASSFQAGQLRLGPIDTRLAVVPAVAADPFVAEVAARDGADRSFDEAQGPVDRLQRAWSALVTAAAGPAASGLSLFVCSRGLELLRPGLGAPGPELSLIGTPDKLPANVTAEFEPHMLAVAVLALGLLVALVRQTRALGHAR